MAALGDDLLDFLALDEIRGKSAARRRYGEAAIEAPAQRFGKFLLYERLAEDGRRITDRARAALRGFAVRLSRLELGATDLTHFFPAFVEEMSRAGFLSHRAILRVHEFGQIDGVPFYTTDDVEGVGLRALLAECRRQRVPLPIGAALYVGREVASALTYASSRRWGRDDSWGVVHSAVVPEEVLITEKGEVKLGGFGLYRALGRVALLRGFLDEGAVEFLAPEVIGRASDGRADTYACVALLYNMLTFRTPREAALAGRPSPPSSLRARVRPELDALCALGLADDPAERAFSAASLEHELGEMLADDSPGYGPADLMQFLTGLRDGTHARALEAKRRAKGGGRREGTGGIEIDVELTSASRPVPSIPSLQAIALPSAGNEREVMEATILAPPPSELIEETRGPGSQSSTSSSGASPLPATDPAAPVVLDSAVERVASGGLPIFAAGKVERSFPWAVAASLLVLGGVAAGLWYWIDGLTDDAPSLRGVATGKKPAPRPLVKGVAPKPAATAVAGASDGGRAGSGERDPFPEPNGAEEKTAEPVLPAVISTDEAPRPAPSPSKRPAVYATISGARDGAGRGLREGAPRPTPSARTEPSAPSAPAAPATPEPTAAEPTAAEPAAPRVEAGGSGYLSLTSELWARVTVDGELQLTTPLVKVALPAGSHTLVLVNPENQLTQRLTLEIRAGETTTRHVTWGDDSTAP